MGAAFGSPEPSDEILCAQAAQGERDAFAELYERYFSLLYDFARRTLRDETAAADVVQAAFERAFVALRKGHTPQRFQGWLFTIASHLCIDEYRQNARYAEVDLMESEEMSPLPVSPYGNPEAEYQRAESVRLVEQAAKGLRPADNLLFDLYFRQGLGADELAATIKMKKGALYTRLSRLKAAFEQSVICLLLLRRGRSGCQQLAAILEELRPAELTYQVRMTLWDHIQDCENCQRNRKFLASPLELFAALPLLPAPPGLKEAIWQRLDASLPSGKVKWKSPLKGVLIVAAGATFLLMAALLAWIWFIALAPRDPLDVHSPSHAIGVVSSNHVIEVAWTSLPGMLAFAISWSDSAAELPDANAELLAGSQTGVASPRLADGVWYFNLRTKGRNGGWTSTVHLGPFRLVGKAAPTPFQPKTVIPVRTSQPSETAILSATPARTSTATSPSSFTPPVTSSLALDTPTPGGSRSPTPGWTPSPTPTHPFLSPTSPAHTLTSSSSPTKVTPPSETPTPERRDKPTDTP